MILIWKGWGILVPIIALVTLMFVAGHTYGPLVAGLVSAVAVAVIGCKLNGRPGRLVVDAETGQKIELKGVHSFFFIKMEYWAFVLATAGIVSVFFMN